MVDRCSHLRPGQNRTSPEALPCHMEAPHPMDDKLQDQPPGTLSLKDHGITGILRMTVYESGDCDVVKEGDFQDNSYTIGMLELLKIELGVAHFAQDE